MITPSTTEPEIQAGRRAFAKAQSLLSGGPIQPSVALNVGWHDTSVNPERGSFAVVANAHQDLVGEIVQVAFSGRTVYAYVLTTADVPVDLSVTRRLFLALNRLTLVSLPCQVSPVQ